ncbi:DUF2231 domain-containing protein [Sphingomonas xanthus]|uniref:DUF2231 domain-containing protein n=1 Tax=Sphingomonas xanthus TaxID=2594473 RepID=A0A516INQ9_9SPHN|nr:DUF2231 domain-containing protein [Sphingomonas xanthus]QDP18551.1 hypothetical protein FMM02_00385 [Sphingomonas xanthus]
MKRNRGPVGIGLLVLAAFTFIAGSPASAHEEHRRQREAALKAEQMRQQVALQPGSVAQSKPDPEAMHTQMGEMMDMPKVDRSKMSATARLFDWIGRLHPIIVHFPIAFFPAAFFTAIVGRRRPAFAKPVQFLVVAGGIIAPIAAVLGWIDGGFTLATDDWLLSFHRWFGTGVGVGALALAIWALRKPEQDRSPGMIFGLGVMTAAMVIQGWFGGALTHGMDHMNW